MEITKLSALEQAKLIREKEISAVELLNATLEQVQKVDGRMGSVDNTAEIPEDAEKVHAFVHIAKDSALKKAAEVDRKIAAGEPVGALAGVPYSAKDVYCTKDIPTCAGAKILAGYEPPYSAAVIEKMDAADAVLFGKTNCDEFTFGSTDETSAFIPVPRNPANLNRVPGGSSGGSAAAVAACEGAISLGSDTGGSIREPASFCGVVGLKPTYGRVSRYGAIPFASSMDTLGPITRTVSDAAAVLQVMAGFDPKDNACGRVDVPDYLADLQKGVKGMRIGLSPDMMQVTYMDESGEFVHCPIDPAVRAAVEKTAEKLQALGAEIIEDVPMANVRYSVPAYFIITRIEAFSNLQRYEGLKYGRATSRKVDDMYDLYAKTRGEGFGFEAKLRLLTGLFASREEFYEKYYLRAQRARALIRQDYDEVFSPAGKYQLDVLLTPATPSAAFPFGNAKSDSPLIRFADMFTSPTNFAGTPGISFPAGVDAEGMPIGVQAIGYDYCESSILRAAYAAEQAL